MARRQLSKYVTGMSFWGACFFAFAIFLFFGHIAPKLPIQNLIIKAFIGAGSALYVPISIGFICIAVATVMRSVFAKRRRQSLFIKQKDISTVKLLSWDEFELMVAGYFESKGYSVVVNTAKGADDGVDIRLRKNNTTSIVQCKHWSKKIGSPVIREHLGAITAHKADGGIVVTSGGFTKSAIEFASKNNIKLIDGAELSAYFKNTVCDDKQSSNVEDGAVSQRVERNTCPVCKAPMIKRKAKKGPNSGALFYGCSEYPRCTGTRKA